MTAGYINRRNFSKRLVQFLACGGLTHFTLVGTAHAVTLQQEASIDCPGGMAPTDVCDSNGGDPDYCPGEMAPADECPQNGGNDEDVCRSGLADADKCDPNIERSDQCTSGDRANDLCPKDDKCWSGTAEDDYCPPEYGLEAGDACPGGGSEFGGMALDLCNPEGSGLKGGDECPEGTWGSEDDCKETSPDRCLTMPGNNEGLFDDDTCLMGSNHGHTLGIDGPDDWCLGSWLASDSCWSGKDEDDLCEDNGGDHGQYDECPGGKKDLDKCGPVGIDIVMGGTKDSDDYCVAGRSDSDECPAGSPPEDECPGGKSDEDVCYAHTAGSDECDRNIAGSDQGGCKKWSDSCYVFDKCNVDSSQDVAE